MIYSITPGQCRAARALLDITQGELAARANCGLSTIVDFEKRRRDISAAAATEIQRALERSGIVFIREGRLGVGVKIAGSQAEAISE
jgi:transcriptional regulator with XRE-family HTH domain